MKGREKVGKKRAEYTELRERKRRSCRANQFQFPAADESIVAESI